MTTTTLTTIGKAVAFRSLRGQLANHLAIRDDEGPRRRDGLRTAKKRTKKSRMIKATMHRDGEDYRAISVVDISSRQGHLLELF